MRCVPFLFLVDRGQEEFVDTDTVRWALTAARNLSRKAAYFGSLFSPLCPTCFHVLDVLGVGGDLAYPASPASIVTVTLTPHAESSLPSQDHPSLLRHLWRCGQVHNCSTKVETLRVADHGYIHLQRVDRQCFLVAYNFIRSSPWPQGGMRRRTLHCMDSEEPFANGMPRSWTRSVVLTVLQQICLFSEGNRAGARPMSSTWPRGSSASPATTLGQSTSSTPSTSSVDHGASIFRYVDIVMHFVSCQQADKQAITSLHFHRGCVHVPLATCSTASLTRAF